MSRHTVKMQNVVVGWSDLENADASLGRARGLFRPGIGYELVQPVFQLFTDAVSADGDGVTDPDKLERYHRSRDALALSLEDESGRQIRTSGIHIEDFSDRPDGRIELEVLISDRAYWGKRDG